MKVKFCFGVLLSVILLVSTASGTTDEFKLIASDGTADDWFGRSVSVSGNKAIISAAGDDTNVGYKKLGDIAI